MPLFKKSTSDCGSMSEAHRKVLHRCRMLLVKDLDITEILDNMTSDDGFKPEVRDYILSLPTREQRVGIFLDKLENKGDRAFCLFLESVKEKYKHVHYVLEETLRTIDDLQDSHQRDRAAVSGETVRKLLRSKLKHKSDQSHVSESVDELEMVLADTDFDSYIDCYSIPMRGKLQKESWIKHMVEPKGHAAQETCESTFMASLVKNSNFQRIDINTIPTGVKLPPKYCVVFVADNENSTGEKSTEIQVSEHVEREDHTADGDTSDNFQDILERQQKAAQDKLPNEAAPPVPPKPEHLPPLSIIAKPKSARSQHQEKEEAEFPLQPPPRTTSKQGASDKPTPLPKPKPKISRNRATVKSRKEEPDGGPPLPPRGSPVSPPKSPHDKLPSEKSKPSNPEPPGLRHRSLSDVTEEQAGTTDEDKRYAIPDKSTTLSNGALAQDVSEDSAFSQSQESEHGMTYVKEKVVEEISSPTEDQVYEPVTPKPMETNLDDMDDDSDDPLSQHVEIESGWEEDDKRSGSAQINGTDESPHNGNSSKTSGDSLNSSSLVSLDDKSSIADSGCENVAAKTKEGKHHGKSTRPPMLLPRGLSEVQNDNDSCEDTSYYEDIEILDKRPASPSGRSTMTYLDPKSYSKSLGGNDLQSVFCDTPRLPTVNRRQTQFSNWEITGKLTLHQSDLLIADEDESMPQDFTGPVSDEASSSHEEEKEDQYSKFIHTKLAYNREGQAFYVPSSLLKKYGDPEGEPWFYPVDMSSRQATLFLSIEHQEGCFVVYRPSRRIPGIAYNLSMCRENGDVVHYHIVENLHGDVMIEGHDHSFMNVRDLVHYFQKNKSQLASRLRRPLKEAQLPVTPGYHYDIRYEVDRNKLNLSGKIIGRGNFGVVCAGTYRNISVAVKVLQKVDATLAEEDDFIEEAKVMIGLKHDHVVRLIGISCTAKPFFLVTEYVAKGNLRDCLRNKVIPPDNIDALFDICIQITAAMYFLESLRFVLHRDVAARNFLVASDMCIKLADFGRAHHVLDDYFQAQRTEKIAIKWAAPEVLLDSVYSTKSDVWSLGVVYWEVFSGGERPYTSLSGEQTAVYVCEGGRLDKPPGCAPDLAAMMKSCWREAPEERPSFAVLYDKLKSKSSIYYAGPSRERNKKRSSSLEPINRISNSYSPGPPKIKSPNRPLTPTGKHKKNVALDYKTEEYVKEVFSQMEEKREQGGERLPTSSSETSLLSASGIIDPSKDDLTRGDKIRKSLRNLIKKPKRKGSKLEEAKDGENGSRSQQSSSGQLYYA